jgi:hypothetical protein
MRKIRAWMWAAAAMLAVQAGLSPPMSAQPAPGQPGPPEAASPAEAEPGGAAGPAGASRPLQTPVLYVTGIEVLVGTLEPRAMVVRVTGLTSSQGWSAPELRPFYYGKPLDNVLDLQLIATSPEESQKVTGFQPISAVFVSIGGGEDFKSIRIRADANALQLNQIPGVAQTAIKSIDCRDCIGKKFAEKGAAAPGTPNTVRAEELPRGFRVIVPSHGVAGIVHNPNRLNLIFDDNNTIVMAFWE